MKKKKIQYSGKLKSYMHWPMIMIAFLVMMNVLVLFINVKAGLVVSVFTVLYIAMALIMYLHHQPSIMNQIISFSAQYDEIQRNVLKNFAIPYAMLDDEGKVIWLNDRFCEVVGKDRKYSKSILNLFPEIDLNNLPADQREHAVQIQYDGKDYEAKLQRISIQNLAESVQLVDIPENRDYVIALYLFDNTQLKQYVREIQDQKLVAGLIQLDNYDEALESVEEVRRSLLVALIDRKITKYISALDGIVKKVEKDKYFIVLKHKELQELKLNRFSLLEEVKTVNIGNDMSVTLSIGIGVGGSSYQQNYEYARRAMDQALGRGGDQAVVKEGGDMSYFGGKSQQMEKNTRVKARTKAHALREIIETKENVVVMGHKITDIDSFGASIAVYRAARLLNKRAHIVLGDINGSIRPWINLFVGNKDYEDDMFIDHAKAEALVDDNTVLVIVDTNRPSMTECEPLLNMTKTIVILDHHRQSSDVIKNAALSYIEPYASSACEMIAEVLQYFDDGVKLKGQEADCIYAGIIIDTNNFMAKTGVRTFEAAAFLRRCGADVTRVRKMFRNDMTSYKARAEAVRHAEVFLDCYAISKCPSQNIESPTIVGAQAANELLNIVGVKASFVITEFNGRIYVSARAIDEVNVQLIMERLGGGGHLNIAGAQMDGITIDEAKEKLKQTIVQMTEEGAI